MATYNIIVLSNPVAGREAEFNEWYAKPHIPDVLKCPGVVTAQRFRRVDSRSSPNATHKYVARYEVETDDLDATMAEIRSRRGGPQMLMSDAFDTASALWLVVVPITEQIKIDDKATE